MIAIAGTAEWERDVAVSVIARMLLAHTLYTEQDAHRVAMQMMDAGEREALEREAALRALAATIRKELGFDA